MKELVFLNRKPHLHDRVGSAGDFDLSKWPLASELLNRAVIDIDIHVIRSARNGVKADITICGGAIQLTGELPNRVRLPGACGKIVDTLLKPRIPQSCL